MQLVPMLTINEVNNLISEHFIKIFGNVVKYYPAAAICVLKNRPFKDAKDICDAIAKYLRGLNINEKKRVLANCPDVVEELCDLSRMLLECGQNNKIIGADKPTIEEKRKLAELNRRYKEKFGFPFKISEKGSTISTVFSKMEERIQNTEEHEIDIAIDEVIKMSKLRIFEIVSR